MPPTNDEVKDEVGIGRREAGAAVAALTPAFGLKGGKLVATAAVEEAGAGVGLKGAGLKGAGAATKGAGAVLGVKGAGAKLGVNVEGAALGVKVAGGGGKELKAGAPVLGALVGFRGAPKVGLATDAGLKPRGGRPPAPPVKVGKLGP